MSNNNYATNDILSIKIQKERPRTVSFEDEEAEREQQQDPKAQFLGFFNSLVSQHQQAQDTRTRCSSLISLLSELLAFTQN